jgi:hypothetical protein
MKPLKFIVLFVLGISNLQAGEVVVVTGKEKGSSIQGIVVKLMRTPNETLLSCGIAVSPKMGVVEILILNVMDEKGTVLASAPIAKQNGDSKSAVHSFQLHPEQYKRAYVLMSVGRGKEKYRYKIQLSTFRPVEMGRNGDEFESTPEWNRYFGLK